MKYLKKKNEKESKGWKIEKKLHIFVEIAFLGQLIHRTVTSGRENNKAQSSELEFPIYNTQFLCSVFSTSHSRALCQQRHKKLGFKLKKIV